MSTHIESLIRNSASTYNGWCKTNNNSRIICVGSQRNCNEDGIICDLTTKAKIIEILNKYNITDYTLNDINTEFVYATELTLEEKVYNDLANKMI